MHAMQVVKQITNLYDIRLMIELIFFSFHGVSSLKSLTPVSWVGPTHNQAIVRNMSVQLDTLILPQLTAKKQVNFHALTRGPVHEGGVSSHNLKDGAFTPFSSVSIGKQNIPGTSLQMRNFAVV